MRTARLLLYLLVTLVAVSATQSEPIAPTARVVAIADIHGDLDAFLRILKRASLIDANQKWSGKDTILVQTGDFLDRGPKTRGVMDFLIQLQKDAGRQNGRVIVLLGNHEGLNIFGDLRDVTPNDYKSYADDKSERRRKSAYDSYAAALGSAPPQTFDEWIKSHPLGFIEHREAMSANGKYGKWLRTLPAVAQVNDSIFLHGGIKTDFATWKIEQINDVVAQEIKNFDAYQKYMVDEKIVLPFYTLKEMTEAAAAALKDPELKDPDRKKFLEGFLTYGGWLSIHPDGPLWFRGYANWSDAEGAPQIKQLLTAFGVTRFVVGHTPQPGGRVGVRFDGHVFLIDTGMLAGYIPGGGASALEILGDKVTPIYP